MPFVRYPDLPARQLFGASVVGRYAHMDHMTAGDVTLAAGTVIPMHDHPHEQWTYIVAGRFRFTIGDETVVLEPGDAALIPGGVSHGGTTLTECRVLDLFSPVREDYRNGTV